MVLNYPNNPTGMSFDADQLAKLAAVCRKWGITVISDEIYGLVHHSASHRSIAEFYPEGTVICSGLSKWCGAGGWRLGYACVPPQLSRLMAAMRTIASETFTSVSAPIQHAAITAFDDHHEIERYLVDSRRLLKALGQWIATDYEARVSMSTIPTVASISSQVLKRCVPSSKPGGSRPEPNSVKRS